MRWLCLALAVAGCGRSTLLGFDDGCNGRPECLAQHHDLAGVDFSEFDFSGVDMAGADLAGRDFAGVDLAGRDFAGVDLAGRDFAGVDLAGRDFAGVDLAGRDFAGVDLAGRDLGRDLGPRDMTLDFSGVDLAGCVPKPENCSNKKDDDCDTIVDCLDTDCTNAPVCINMLREICNNGFDDDNNGLADCDDPACFGDPNCFVPGQEICNNKLDDDQDGQIDCADPDCKPLPICQPVMGNEICDNGIDDNGDGLVDCLDPKCAAFPACIHFDCTIDVSFGNINPHDSSVTRTMDTRGATQTFSTCAFPGGTARVGEFTLTGTADVRLDFTQAPGSAHVVSLFRAGVLQACDENLVFCLQAGQAPTATHTYSALPAGIYRVIVQSFSGTQGSTTVKLSTGPSAKMEICDNGIDDDGNGLIDCADLACKNAMVCINNQCNADINLGTLVVGAMPKHANFDTHNFSNRYHPTCAGTSTGKDTVVRITLAETAGILVRWQQTGDHVITVFKEPGPGQPCDAIQQSCYYPGGGPGGQVAFSPRPAGSYLLIFKAVRAGGEGVLDINVSAWKNSGVEICTNTIDDDGDGLADCDDSDCFGVGVCRPPVCIPDVDLGNFDINTVQSMTLDTTSANDFYTTRCGQGTGKERVVQLNLLQPMALGFSCTQTGAHVLQLAAHLNPLDPCDANEFNCADPQILPFGCNFAMPNLQAGRYEVIVEAFHAGDEGIVDLTLFGLAENVLEVCDNGVDDDGDGFKDCDDLKCVTSPLCAKFACRPDQDIGILPLDGSTHTVVLQTSTGTVSTRVPTCVSAVGGKFSVVDVTIPATANLAINWAQVGNHDFAVFLDQSDRAACDANPLVACLPTNMSGGAGSFNLPGVPRGKYHVIVYADQPGLEGGVVLSVSGTP